MNLNNKKTTSIIIIAVAIILSLILSIVVIALFSSKPNSPIKKPITSSISSSTDEEDQTKYTVLGRIYDIDEKPLANVKLFISCGNTEFSTDENGWFKLIGLPPGMYDLSMVTDNDKKIGTTTIFLSNDGCVTIGYDFFENGKTVYLIFDGKEFKAYTPKKIDNISSSTSSSDDSPSEPSKEVDSEEAITNLSWMADIPMEYGAYGFDLYYDVEFFYDTVNSKEYDYLSTFFVSGNNLDKVKLEAKELKKNDKRFWLNVNDILSIGSSDPNTNLVGNWREVLMRYASELKKIGGDNFQGFYFDEPHYLMNDRDFTRVTKYMRETFKLRVFAIHAGSTFTLPYSKGMSIINYHPQKDEWVISAKNHKYVTDVGYWSYGAPRWYTAKPQYVNYKCWKDAMSLLNPQVRKWIVPPCGSYDWRHSENDCLDLEYDLYYNLSQIEGFGGIMMYSMDSGILSGMVAHVEPDEERLTDSDFLKDENGDFVLKNGKKVVNFKENHSATGLDGVNNAYVEMYAKRLIMEKKPDGSRYWQKAFNYFEIFGKSFQNGESREAILKKLEGVYKPDYSLSYWITEIEEY